MVKNLAPLEPLIDEEHKRNAAAQLLGAINVGQGNEATLETSRILQSSVKSKVTDFFKFSSIAAVDITMFMYYGLIVISPFFYLNHTQVSSAALSVGNGNKAKAQPEKFACQKKPIEELAAPSHLSR